MDLTKNILVINQLTLDNFRQPVSLIDINYIMDNFCGKVQSSIDDYNSNNIYYLTGDINKFNTQSFTNIYYIVKELSYNYNDNNIINIGQVPININNVGVYFRNFFDDKDYFSLLSKEHEFQDLTESNKPGISYRKGIYITKVEKLKK